MEMVTTCHGMNFPLVCSAFFCGHLQAAAAGNLHAEDGHALDVVAAQDLGQLFAVIHSVQLRAADEGYLAAHKLLMEIGVGIGCAVRCNQ